MKLADEVLTIKSAVIFLNAHFPSKPGEPTNFVGLRHPQTQNWHIVVRGDKAFVIFYSSKKFQALKTLIRVKSGMKIDFRIVWDTYVYWNIRDKKGIQIG